VIAHHVDRPVPGHYWRKLVKGGPRVPCIIFVPCPLDPYTGEPLDRPRHLRCLVGDDEADPHEQWSWLAGNRISAVDYDLMCAQVAWDRTYAPLSPGANPRLPIDLSQLAIPF
jgi:hypothetical protein